MGTKIGAKIAHLAEPEDTKNVDKGAEENKSNTQRNTCEADVLQEVSAARMANSVPNLVQLKRPWNCPQKKQNRT